MTTYRTDLRTHDVATLLGVSRRQVSRYVGRGWLKPAWFDGAGPRFNEIDVLGLKRLLRNGELIQRPSRGGKKQSRAASGPLGLKVTTPATVRGLQ